MRKYLLATAMTLALAAPAAADVIIDNHLSGTGDNVILNGRRDLVSIGTIAGVCLVYSFWVGAETAMMLGIPSGILAWIAIENWYAT
jgi:hypothetical protein